jgi:ATP-dependent Lhr-like helicase
MPSSSAPSPDAGPSAGDVDWAWAQVEGWFAEQGWAPFDFQREVWRAYRRGESGLVHAETGTGKTLAVWGAALIRALARRRAAGRPPAAEGASDGEAAPLRVLWITPLRALSADTVQALRAPAEALGLPWTVEARTGDTSSRVKKRQKTDPPTALVTTPESLSILLTYPTTEEAFSDLELVVVDEWHELLSTKRGTQTELGLARLRRWCPSARLWGLSATLGNLEEARDALVGTRRAGTGRLVAGDVGKTVGVDALTPDDVERFPWGGHLGLSMVEPVARELDEADSALVFTNTRAQAEEWYQKLLERRPSWAGTIALHYGSLSRQQRRFVERGLAEGELRCVVCTSTLDLGVDFTPVERVFQVGSPKGVARLLQRAGRSGHQPGRPSRATGVPSHALQLLEYAAARVAAERRSIEARPPLEAPLDVLAQHVVTVAIGSGFDEDALYDEVRSAYAYRDLERATWDWLLDFLQTGGDALSAYDEYRRITRYDGDDPAFAGRFVATDNDIVKRHRMSIGTILSDAMVTVRYQNGYELGRVEESFVSRLDKGDPFNFAGKTLEYRRMKDMEVVVRKAKKRPSGPVPRYLGGSLPLSGRLAGTVREILEAAREGTAEAPEIEALEPLLELQAEWSRIPSEDALVLERTTTREGHHLFAYPFAGKSVHEGLAALAGTRLARIEPRTFSMSFNEYGFELVSDEPAPLRRAIGEGLFEPGNLEADIEESLNETQMARRRFRRIARVAGLVFPGYPGRQKSLRQIQSSSGLIFDVLDKYEPDHPLLEQARREVRTRQLETDRLRDTLERLAAADLHVIDTPRLTPFAFPIYVERLRQRVSSESLAARVQRMQRRLEKAAG